jgi:hypothetical protein
MTKAVTFILKVQPALLDQKYNFLSKTEEKCPDNKTRLLDLQNQNRNENNHFSFLDESKKDHQCVVTMKKYITQETLPTSTMVHCFWCRHSFTYKPIGCPIEYIPNRIIKKYHSEITKDIYVLRENVTSSQLKDVKPEDPSEIQVQNRDYYLMDGLFCSFNCCLSFIKDHSSEALYHNSETYLNKIYYDIFGTSASKLICAPSWRLLKDYGGHMTIDEYRKNFYKVDFFDVDNIICPFPNSKPVGFLFEKQIRL